jgi:cell wall-associated NlpC family hydrolase
MSRNMFEGGTSTQAGVGNRAGRGFEARLCVLGLHVSMIILIPILILILTILAAGCATTGAVPQPFPRPGGAPVPSGSALPPAPAPSAGPADGYAIAGTALGLRGSPYRNGGSDPSGFDCSGFVRYVFAQHGIGLGRTVGEQFREGTEVTAAVEAGDLIFFTISNGGSKAGAVSHVGMAIGGDEFVHAPSSRGEVRVERLTAPYWSSRYIGARRMR